MAPPPEPEAGPEDGPPRTEVEQLQFKINETTDESLESTRRMRQLCEDSKEAGIRTLVALDEQGEQLDRVEEDMDKINTDMKEAEKALSGMEQCCGLCTCPCGKTKEFQEDEATWKGNDDGKIVGGQPVRTVDDRGGGGAMVGSYIARVTKDDREDEMEENMQDVNNMIGNLRNMAIDMGSEIGAQNAKLDESIRRPSQTRHESRRPTKGRKSCSNSDGTEEMQQ